MRLPVYNTPRVFDCSYEDRDFLGIPHGCVEALTDLLEAYNIPYSLEDQRQAGRVIDISFYGTLRQEQVPAVDALLEHLARFNILRGRSKS